MHIYIDRKVEGGGETLKQTSAPSSLEERNRTCGCLGFTSPLPKMALLEQANNAPPENCFRLVILGSAKVSEQTEKTSARQTVRHSSWSV